MGHDICGIFTAEYDRAERAKAVVKSMKDCPRLLMAGTVGEKTSMVFIVPDSLRWWFEGPAENPELLGAKNVEVFVVEEIAYPEGFQPRLPDSKAKTPPCGSNCVECPMRDKYNCSGCPATKTS